MSESAQSESHELPEPAAEAAPEIVTCDTCGVSSPIADAFTTTSKRGRKRRECPTCAYASRRNSTAVSYLSYLACLILGLALLAMGSSFGW